jgi:hypothetical protein
MTGFAGWPEDALAWFEGLEADNDLLRGPLDVTAAALVSRVYAPRPL